MNAKEMFEAIGYHQVVISPKYCSYSFDDGGYIKSIEFIGIKKEIRLHDLETYNDNKSQDVFVLNEYELKAINKQCEELGWLEEEKHEIKQETNFEHYNDKILEDYAKNLAVVKGRHTLCYKTNCNDCDFKINQIGCIEKAKDWLKQPHEKQVFKLTKFEKELLECYPDINSFKVFNSLNGMRKKGYFKGIDDNEIIGYILAKSEVVG